jgi:hypothetical protein
MEWNTRVLSLAIAMLQLKHYSIGLKRSSESTQMYKPSVTKRPAAFRKGTPEVRGYLSKTLLNSDKPGKSFLIYKDPGYGGTIVQQELGGNTQRLAMDENGMRDFVGALMRHGWQEAGKSA